MILKKTILISATLLQCIILSAQKPTAVTEKIETIKDITGNVLYVNVHRADERTIIKELKSELKNKNGEVKTKRKELSATGVSFPSLSDSAVTITAEVKEEKKLEYNLMLIFQYNDSILSSTNNSAGYQSVKTFLIAFANKLSKEANEEYLKKQKEELKQLENKLDELEKKLKKEEKQIAKSNKLTKKNQAVVEKINKNGVLNEKVMKSRAKSETSILKEREEIKDAEYNIEINKKEQKETLEEIKKQEKAVKEAQKSLDVFK